MEGLAPVLLVLGAFYLFSKSKAPAASSGSAAAQQQAYQQQQLAQQQAYQQQQLAQQQAIAQAQLEAQKAARDQQLGIDLLNQGLGILGKGAEVGLSYLNTPSGSPNPNPGYNGDNVTSDYSSGSNPNPGWDNGGNDPSTESYAPPVDETSIAYA